MEKTEKNIGFSQKFLEESEKLEEGLKRVSEKLIAETKATNSYLVIADKEGNIKKVDAKDL